MADRGGGDREGGNNRAECVAATRSPAGSPTRPTADVARSARQPARPESSAASRSFPRCLPPTRNPLSAVLRQSPVGLQRHFPEPSPLSGCTCSGRQPRGLGRHPIGVWRSAPSLDAQSSGLPRHHNHNGYRDRPHPSDFLDGERQPRDIAAENVQTGLFCKDGGSIYTARGRDCPMCIARPPRVQGGRGMHASREAAYLLSPCTLGDDRGAPISTLRDQADLKYHRKSSLSRSHETISAARGRHHLRSSPTIS